MMMVKTHFIVVVLLSTVLYVFVIFVWKRNKTLYEDYEDESMMDPYFIVLVPRFE
jgi:hypothetical protein